VSNCVIKLRVGEESIEVAVDSSLLPESFVALKTIL
jgi:hypothetical protein